MPSIKEYDNKLKVLNNTEKMTRTMKLVSMSKLYKAQEAQKNAKVYAHALTDLIHRLSATLDRPSHPLLLKREIVNNVLILVIESDKGLCGSYNNSLNKGVMSWIKKNRAKYKGISLSLCGKRGYMYFKNHPLIHKYYKDAVGQPDFSAASVIADEISDNFLSGKFDEVYVSYNNYHSPLSQTPTFDKVLPIEPRELLEGGQKITFDYIFEPQERILLEFLVPKYLYFRVYFALLENAAGEHGARMTAMDNATKNSNKLIDQYTVLKNRARQAAITTELIEIVSGAEAL